MYRLLEQTEPVLPTDEFWMDVAEVWSNDWEPEDIGKPASIMPSPVRRRLVTDWQTGSIPEPTGPCVLVVEAKNPKNNGHYTTHKERGIFYWSISPNLITPNQCKELPVATGRWCIQSIILPATDGI